MTVASTGSSQRSSCWRSARAAAAWPSPTSAERIKTRRGPAARGSGEECFGRRRKSDDSPLGARGESQPALAASPTLAGEEAERKDCLGNLTIFTAADSSPPDRE